MRVRWREWQREEGEEGVEEGGGGSCWMQRLMRCSSSWLMETLQTCSAFIPSIMASSRVMSMP